MMVHFYISQDFGLTYCHRTIEEVAWLPLQKVKSQKGNHPNKLIYPSFETRLM